VDSEQRYTLFSRLKANNPYPATELHYHTPFELMVAVILSAQATDVSVNKATVQLFKVANTPQAMLKLGEEGLKKYIKTIGLSNTKARNIIKTCTMLIDHYQGELPRQRAKLESLPGIGRKSANVLLNTVFGEPTIGVDTHIFRVANRTGLACGKTVREVEDQLVQSIPEEFLHHAHHWLVLQGRYICTARKPRCYQCVIFDLCEYAEKVNL
jgi:endonuclease-3